MEIDVLDGKYQLTSDALNVMVHEKRTVDPTKAPNWPKRAAEGADPTPREVWSEPVGYFTNVEKALGFIFDREVRLSPATTIGELLGDIAELKRGIEDVLSRQ